MQTERASVLSFCVCWCIVCAGDRSLAQQSASPAREMPDQQTIRAALGSLSWLPKSGKIMATQTAHLEYSAESRGRDMRPLSYEIVYQDDRTFQRLVRDPESRKDEITILQNGVMQRYMRNPNGPGYGKVNRPDGLDAAGLRAKGMPWFGLKERFDLNPASSDFQVVALREHRGMQVLEITWTMGSKASGYPCRALLSLEDQLMPVMIEKMSPRGEFRYRDEVTSVNRLAGGFSFPVEVVETSVVSPEMRDLFKAEDRPKVAGDQLYHINTWQVKSAEANPQIDETLFTMPWQRGTEVVDEIAGITYYTGQDFADHARVNDPTSRPVRGAAADLNRYIANTQDQKTMAAATTQPGAVAASQPATHLPVSLVVPSTFWRRNNLIVAIASLAFLSVTGIFVLSRLLASRRKGSQ